MTTNRNAVSNLTCACDVLSKFNTDASNKEVCAGNKAMYRVSSANGTGVTVFSNLVPLRANTCYMLDIRLVAASAANPICVIYNTSQVNFFGGVMGQQTTQQFISQSVAGNSITLAKNATNNTIDVTTTITLGGTVAFTLEI